MGIVKRVRAALQAPDGPEHARLLSAFGAALDLAAAGDEDATIESAAWIRAIAAASASAVVGDALIGLLASPAASYAAQTSEKACAALTRLRDLDPSSRACTAEDAASGPIERAAKRRRGEEESRSVGRESESEEDGEEVEGEAVGWDEQARVESAGGLWAFPDELLAAVLSLLGPADLAALSMASRFWRAAASEPRLWMRHYAARFGMHPCCQGGGVRGGAHAAHRWKEMYGERVAATRALAEGRARRSRSPWQAGPRSRAALVQHATDHLPEPPFMREIKWLPCDHARPPAGVPWAHGTPQWASGCTVRLQTFGALHRHLALHERSRGPGPSHSRPALACPHARCGLRFPNPRALAAHAGEAHGAWPAGVAPVACPAPACRRAFASRKQMVSHFDHAHRAQAAEPGAPGRGLPAAPEALPRCDLAGADGSACGRRFLNERGLRRHQRRAHGGSGRFGGPPYRCPQDGCPAQYDRVSLLESHIGGAHAELAAAAGIAVRGESSRQRRSLAGCLPLERTADGGLPCPVAGCGRAFPPRSHSALRRHVVARHPEALPQAGPGLALTCPDCGAPFPDASGLARHALVRHGRGRFPRVCTAALRVRGAPGRLLCGYGAFNGHDLRVHAASRAHAAAEYFMCPVPSPAPAAPEEVRRGPERRWGWNRPGFPRCYRLLPSRAMLLQHLRRVHGLEGAPLAAARVAAERPPECPLAPDPDPDEGAGPGDVDGAGDGGRGDDDDGQEVEARDEGGEA